MFKEALSQKLPIFATFTAAALLLLNLYAALSPLQLLCAISWRCFLVYVAFKIWGKLLSSFLYWKIPHIDSVKRLQIRVEDEQGREDKAAL